jgi:hypothetical protein
MTDEKTKCKYNFTIRVDKGKKHCVNYGKVVILVLDQKNWSENNDKLVKKMEEYASDFKCKTCSESQKA